MISDHFRAYFMLVVTSLCWAANAVLSKLAVGEVSPMLLVAFRWLGTFSLIMVLAYKYVRQDWPILRSRLPFICVMGTIGFTIFNALFYFAPHYTTALNMGILQGAMPIFILIGSFFAYQATITPLQAIGILFATIGVITVVSGGDLQKLINMSVNLGDGLMIIACMFFAGYSVSLQRRPATSILGLFTMFAGVALVTSLPLVTLEFALNQAQWPSLKGWGVIALVVLFPSFLAQMLFIKSIEAIGPGRAGVFVNLVPVFTAILAVVILDESFMLLHIVALGLVLGGILLSEWAKLH